MSSHPSTEQCVHGSLKRSCEICERDAEIVRLRAALKLVSDHAVLSTHHNDQNLISMWVLGEVRSALALPDDVAGDPSG